ncbi:60S ribosomal protein L3-1 [Tanacetum coccineum]
MASSRARADEGLLHKKETSDVVTIIETPPIMVVGVVAYVNTPRSLPVWAQHLNYHVLLCFGDLDEVVEIGRLPSWHEKKAGASHGLLSSLIQPDMKGNSYEAKYKVNSRTSQAANDINKILHRLRMLESLKEVIHESDYSSTMVETNLCPDPIMYQQSGARCVATLLHEMRRRGKDSRFGVVSMCIGMVFADRMDDVSRAHAGLGGEDLHVTSTIHSELAPVTSSTEEKETKAQLGAVKARQEDPVKGPDQVLKDAVAG